MRTNSASERGQSWKYFPGKEINKKNGGGGNIDIEKEGRALLP